VPGRCLKRLNEILGYKGLPKLGQFTIGLGDMRCHEIFYTIFRSPMTGLGIRKTEIIKEVFRCKASERTCIVMDPSSNLALFKICNFQSHHGEMQSDRDSVLKWWPSQRIIQMGLKVLRTFSDSDYYAKQSKISHTYGITRATLITSIQGRADIPSKADHYSPATCV
jgi:hypothetical protein